MAGQYFPRRHGLLNENLNARRRISSYQLLVSESLRAPNDTGFCIALGCSPELGGKIPLLKTQHNLVAALQEIKEEVT